MPLKRHPALVPLSHDHQRGLFAANLIRSGAPNYPGLPTDLEGKLEYLHEYYRKNLSLHLREEEEVLFPRVKELSDKIGELVEELLKEHEAIRESFEKLPDSVSPELQAQLDGLSILLRDHIRKEERQLFEEIQKTMDEASLETLGELILKAKSS